MDAKQIIKALGGVAETARLCEVTNSAVCQWESNGIPRARLMFLRLARPDVFGNPVKNATRNRRKTDQQ